MPDAPFTVPYPQHTHFVGREDDLARLHAALQGEGPVGINPAALGNPTGLTGQGGIGKTQLAVAYAYGYRDAYPDGVYWLNAANDLRLEFAALAEQLYLPLAGAAAVQLDAADRQVLVSMLAGAADLQTGPAGRAAFLRMAGLERFVSALDLNGSPRAVAMQLVGRLEPYGILPDRPTHHALGALLEYLARLDDTSPTDARRLAGLIGRYRLVMTGANVSSQDERISAAFAWLRAHPRHLLIFDNVADPAALDEPLTRDCAPGRLPGGVLFTTRRRALGRFRPVELKTLPPDAALALLLRDARRHPARDPAHPEHMIARDICAVFGYLPLALEIAAAHLARYHTATLAAYYDELLRRGALDVMADPHVAVDTRHEAGLNAALAAQWVTLGQEAQLVLRVAGQLAEAAYLPAARLGLLAGVPDEDARFFTVTLGLALAELQDASLIEELAGDQARLHPLVREFARDRTPVAEKADFRAACVGRLLAALRDIDTLARQVDARGIDAVLRDLLAARDLLDGTGDADTARDLGACLGVLRREAHNLRGWRRDDAPGFLAQQLHWRLFDSATPALFGDLAARLRAQGRVWRPGWAARSETPGLEMTLTGHTDRVRAVAVTPDGRRAVSGGDDRTLRVWDLATGREERTLTGHTGAVNTVAVTPDGRRAVSGASDGTLRVWDLATGRAERTLTGHTDWVRAVAVAPDGRRAVSDGGDCTLRVWNLDTAESERTLTGHTGTVLAVAVTSDGQRAVSGGSDCTLRVWNLDTAESERTLTGHAGGVGAVVLTSDGQRAVSSADDQTLRVWALDTGKVERTLAGHEGRVRAVALTPDERRAFSGGDDRTLRLWELHTGRELARAAFDAAVTCVAIAPGSPPLVVAGDAAGNVYCLEWVE